MSSRKSKLTSTVTGKEKTCSSGTNQQMSTSSSSYATEQDIFMERISAQKQVSFVRGGPLTYYLLNKKDVVVAVCGLTISPVFPERFSISEMDFLKALNFSQHVKSQAIFFQVEQLSTQARYYKVHKGSEAVIARDRNKKRRFYIPKKEVHSLPLGL